MADDFDLGDFYASLHEQEEARKQEAEQARREAEEARRKAEDAQRAEAQARQEAQRRERNAPLDQLAAMNPVRRWVIASLPECISKGPEELPLRIPIRDGEIDAVKHLCEGSVEGFPERFRRGTRIVPKGTASPGPEHQACIALARSGRSPFTPVNRPRLD